MKIIDLPLHYGSVPRYLLNKMRKLSYLMVKIILDEFGSEMFLKKLADPLWFQAFSNFLGFDWHSSGATTVSIGILKSLEFEEFKVCGGKGKSMIKTHQEIKEFANKNGLDEEKLILLDRISFRIDNAYVQDGFSLYHHAFIIDENGNYLVIQQGMNNQYARRYHWFNFDIKEILEPHTGIISDLNNSKTLDLTKKDNKEIQKSVLDFINEKDFRMLFKQKTLFEDVKYYGSLPKNHYFSLSEKERVLLEKLADKSLIDFKDLVLETTNKDLIRALALASSLVYDIKLRYGDPKIYSYAHGGKDGIPKPIDYKTYDEVLKTLSDYIDQKQILLRGKFQSFQDQML